MGTHFFKPPNVHPTGGLNLQARANNAPSYTGRTAAAGDSKSIDKVAAINKAVGALNIKKSTGTAAYAPGPKRL